MGLTATASGSDDFRPLPAGTYRARCVRLIDLGTQPGGGRFPSPKHKVLLAFEVPDEMVEWEGKQEPTLIFSRYTMSLGERAILCRDLEAWRGRKFTDEEKQGFDLKAVLGAACMITVLHAQKGDKTYVNISSVAKPPKGMDVPPAHHNLVSYAIEDGESDVFKGFSEGLQNTIRGAQEWQGASNGNGAAYDEPPVHVNAGSGGHDAPPPQDDDYAGGFEDDDIPF